MAKHKIFVSSVQGEFADERKALRDHVAGDKAWRKLFDVFLFENSTARDTTPQNHFLGTVDESAIFVGLLGRRYGTEDESGLSPTEQEFQRASERGKHRLIFLKRMKMGEREPKMRNLVERVQKGLVRKAFDSTEELLRGFDDALFEFLSERALEREKFDEAPCKDAGLQDLDSKKIKRYILYAKATRGFPLRADTAPSALLKHLKLMKGGKPTNAALLLFGKDPQQFLLNSSVKCVSSRTTQLTKPLSSHHIYDGTVFELLDQALDFVLGRIDRAIGTRASGPQATRTHEIPPEVVTEAIANALTHRDYTSSGSIQVTVYPDRIEVWNPGGLLPPLTLSDLHEFHGSFPRNPALIRALRRTPFVEEIGSGTLDMIKRCLDAGLPEPEFESSGTFNVRIWRAKNRTCEVTVRLGNNPAEDMDILVVSSNGESTKSFTDKKGRAYFETRTSRLPKTVFVAGDGRTACAKHNWIPDKSRLTLRTSALDGGGSAIFPHGSGHLPGLPGRLTIDYAGGRSGRFFRTDVPDGSGTGMARGFTFGKWFRVATSGDTTLQARVVESMNGAVLLEFQSTILAASKFISLEERVLLALADGPMSRSELAAYLGQTSRTGQLSSALRHLFSGNLVVFTIPGKPRSQHQKYNLTSRGKQAVSTLKSSRT